MEEANLEINHISPENCFFLCNGEVFRNLVELGYGMDLMDPETFEFHVNEHKNDFANWVCDVMQEHELAEALKQTQSRDKMQIAILKHIVKNHK